MRDRIRRTVRPCPATRAAGRRASFHLAAASAVATGIIAAGRAAGAADVSSTWGGGDGNWGTPTAWNNAPPVNQFPNNGNGGLTYDAVINSGTVTLDQDITIQALTLTPDNDFFSPDPAVTGPKDLTINGLFTWSRGIVSGAGVITANGGAALTQHVDVPLTSAGQSLRQRTLNLPAGTTSTISGNMDFRGGAVLNNAGTLLHTASVGDLQFGGADNNFFNNSGTFIKRGSRVTQFHPFITFTNTGTVNVETGTLAISAGGAHTGAFVVAAGAALEHGSVTEAVASTFSTSASVSGAGHVLFGSSNVQLPTTFAGTYNVTGATTFGSRRFFSGGTVTFTPEATVSALGETVTFEGGGKAVFNNPQVGHVASLEVLSGGPTFNTGRPVTVSTLTLSGGEIGGSDNLTVSNPIAWSAGHMTGTGATTAAAGVSLSDGAIFVAIPVDATRYRR